LAEETTQAIGEQVMRLNAGGCIAVGRALLRHMLGRQHGHLVPIASMAARVPSPGQAEYCAAKHAIIGYYMSVAAEVAERGVSVTVACPGPIAGERVRIVFGARGRIEKTEEATSTTQKVPMRRCCALICRAAAFNVREAWIARHPVLFIAYLACYMPAVATAVLARVGPKRARALSEGRSGYDYKLARKCE
jgi:dehydrogenase/reductase SDR family member 7